MNGVLSLLGVIPVGNSSLSSSSGVVFPFDSTNFFVVEIPSDLFYSEASETAPFFGFLLRCWQFGLHLRFTINCSQKLLSLLMIRRDDLCGWTCYVIDLAFPYRDHCGRQTLCSYYPTVYSSAPSGRAIWMDIATSGGSFVDAPSRTARYLLCIAGPCSRLVRILRLSVSCTILSLSLACAKSSGIRSINKRLFLAPYYANQTWCLSVSNSSAGPDFSSWPVRQKSTATSLGKCLFPASLAAISREMRGGEGLLTSLHPNICVYLALLSSLILQCRFHSTRTPSTHLHDEGSLQLIPWRI